MKKCYLIVMCSLFLTSCQFVPTITQKELNASYTKKSDAEANLQAVKLKYDKDLLDVTNRISETKDKVIKGQDEQIQAGANALYTINQATLALPAPGAAELTKDRAVEGFTAMGKSPTVKEIIEGGERLRKYLTTYASNNQAEIENLRKEHQRLVAENGVLAQASEAAKKEVIKVEGEKAKLAVNQVVVLDAAQKKVADAADAVIAAENKARIAADAAKAKAENVERLKKQLMIWCGIGALAATVGMIYSPVFKGGLGTIAAILGGATIVIPFIQAWMVWIVLGAGLLAGVAVGASFLYRHHVAEKSNENMVNAIEDTKQKPNATIDDLKSNLRDWNKTYAKNKAGEYVEVVDKSVEKYIKSKLADYGRLDTTKKEPKV